MPGADIKVSGLTTETTTLGDGVVLIALTGYGHENDRERAQEAEFDGYLVKPVDMAALRAMLARLARR